ncbi:MAG TPA: thioredoxin domain-containing protein [Acidimicrobiales bacterium]
MNRLAEETSPYLRQHRDNPVDWYPWGPEAFARAAAEDRPVLLSVGYAACHWCHVMAHECFEDAEVAAVMNELFVSVKVDREERPDVDAVYMDAVQAMTGHGGWPMTVFLTPDGRPFYGGTYYPKPSFLQLLPAIADAWRNRRDEVMDSAGHLIRSLDRTAQLVAAPEPPGITQLNAALQQLAAAFDAEWGGFGAAPKFPQTMNLELLLRATQAGAGEPALTVVTTTLDAMASGGIYDHLGGGFARYSVDQQWLVPHFEKMLYDQALLTQLYLHAWQVTGEDRYRQVVEETIGYVLADLCHPDGGFYSSEDADSEGVEGRFYVWTPEQITEVLGAELGREAMDWYGVTEAGNFEGHSILTRPVRGDLVRPAEVEEARARLLEARSTRIRPGLDDKVLTEWNALMLAALAEAGAAMARTDWLEAARANAEHLLGRLRRDDGRWQRSWQADGGARHDALAADHAALVEAFIALAIATGEARWITEARATADTMLDHFWDPSNGGLFTTADDGEALIVRQKDLMDNATPAANSLAVTGLVRLAALTGEARYQHQADQILQLVGGLVEGAPTAFGRLLAAVDMRRVGVTEIAVVGDRPDLVAAVHARYLPNAVMAWGEPYASPLWDERRDGWAYVCRDYACQAPVDSVDLLTGQLEV